MIYYQIMAAMFVLLGFVGLFLRRAQSPAWFGIDAIQFLLILPMLNHNVGL